MSSPLRTISSRFTRLASTLPSRHIQAQTRSLTASSRIMAAPTPEDISKVSHAEGGTTKGSSSAQMQSELGKTRNFEQAAQEVGSKMQQAPETVTSEDANLLRSREARAQGGVNPEAGSISSDAQHQAAVNEGATKQTGGQMPPTAQSHLDKEANFQQATEQVGSKMVNNPEAVTKEDANLLHSREHRAHGATERGGIASQAQSLATENEGKKS